MATNDTNSAYRTKL